MSQPTCVTHYMVRRPKTGSQDDSRPSRRACRWRYAIITAIPPPLPVYGASRELTAPGVRDSVWRPVRHMC